MNEMIKRDEISTTNTDKYVLSDCGKKLLEVLVNPDNTGKSVTEKCQLADISRDTYYKLMKEDGFIDILNETSVSMIKGHVNDILQAMYKFSLKDPKCHSDRIALLRKCGVIEDKEFNGNVMIVRFDD